MSPTIQVPKPGASNSDTHEEEITSASGHRRTVAGQGKFHSDIPNILVPGAEHQVVVSTMVPRV